jgi:putative transposase
MARLARLTLANHPHHILQVGNNQMPVFRDSADRQHLLDLLAESARLERVAVHAYVLLDNQFQLLATPEDIQGIPRLMQAVGRRYVRAFNARHGRSGTLWDGRYKSTLIQADRYLLDCMVYLDTAPVRAGLTDLAKGYPWSSHDEYLGLRQERIVTPHPLVWELGNTPFAREIAYGEKVEAGLPADMEAKLAGAARTGWALGDAEYLGQLQKQTERRVSRAKVGRPRLAVGPEQG